MTLPIVLSAIALKLATDLALDYLYPDGTADGTLSTTVIPSENYTPPYIGGQCLTQYTLALRVRQFQNGALIFTSNNILHANSNVRFGQITNISPALKSNGDAFNGYKTTHRNNQGQVVTEVYPSGFSTSNDVLTAIVDQIEILRVDNQLDNCGNVPDPNAAPLPQISSGGAPQNGTPVITGNDALVEAGLPVLAIPPILTALLGLAAQLGAAVAAAQAAAETLAAIKATAEAVKKLAEQLDLHKEIFEKLRVYLNQKEREEDAKKRYFIRQYGTILRDGYLDITPRPAPVGFKPIMLDFRCENIPNGIGRFFGKDSYNWFRYQELGSICFLSPTSGVLSIHKIEHVRTSIAIPDLAIGFTYNMGLNGIIRARVSMLYTQEKS